MNETPDFQTVAALLEVELERLLKAFLGEHAGHDMPELRDIARRGVRGHLYSQLAAFVGYAREDAYQDGYQDGFADAESQEPDINEGYE